MDYETNRILSQEKLDNMGEELSNCAKSFINQQFKKISNDMDYEKKYKEALEKAKTMIDDLRKGEDILAVSELESMFPELKESEDEKIRRELIDYINRLTASPNSIDKYNTWIAWLEKQGEQKASYTTWSKKDDEIRKALIKGFNECLVSSSHYPKNAIKYWHGIVIEDILSWLEKQGEQNLSVEMKTPEESLGVDSDTYSKIVDECIYGEQKPAWSEEDEEMLVDCFNILHRSDYSTDKVTKTINWLKSLKQRVGG